MRYVEETSIRALKIRHNNVLGYFVDVTAQHGDKLMSAPLNATFIHRQTLAGQVRFTGRYRSEDRARLYGETDVGLVPQPPGVSCDHTVPNKLYDYLACGKPVIVSPARPLRRIVEETQAGVVLDRCSPEAIAAAIERVRGLDLGRLSANGLRASRGRYHWDHDAAVLVGFLKGYLRADRG